MRFRQQEIFIQGRQESKKTGEGVGVSSALLSQVIRCLQLVISDGIHAGVKHIRNFRLESIQSLPFPVILTKKGITGIIRQQESSARLSATSSYQGSLSKSPDFNI